MWRTRELVSVGSYRVSAIYTHLAGSTGAVQ